MAELLDQQMRESGDFERTMRRCLACEPEVLSQPGDISPTRDQRHDRAWDPQPTNRELLTRTREVERRYALSWWDSIIVAAAQLQDCRTLLSEDLRTIDREIGAGGRGALCQRADGHGGSSPAAAHSI